MVVGPELVVGSELVVEPELVVGQCMHEAMVAQLCMGPGLLWSWL